MRLFWWVCRVEVAGCFRRVVSCLFVGLFVFWTVIWGVCYCCLARVMFGVYELLLFWVMGCLAWMTLLGGDWW